MALKAIIHKATLQIADMDRQLYADHTLTLARHPSETDERLMVRLLAFALQVPHDDKAGALAFAKGLSDSDEPDLWRHDLSGQLLQWVEVGQPEERRLARACGKARQVVLYGYSRALTVWWAGIEERLRRLGNLDVWQIPTDHSQALATLCSRAMGLSLTVQDGHVWVSDAAQSVEVVPHALMRARPGR